MTQRMASAADLQPGPPPVAIDDVSKRFGAGADAIEALSLINLQLEAGTTTALVGPSGCGKSTLLRIIAGLETATTGAVSIGGATPAEVSRAGHLSVAFQDPCLLPWRTAAANVALARDLAGQPADPKAVSDLLELVGLAGFEDKRPAELSGGMRQRCAIARCLITHPRLLLLDEPFGAVDEMTRRRLNLELPRIWEGRGTTALLVTHSITEAVLLADRVLVMSHRPARVVADVRVPIERPRRAGHLDDRRFAELTAQIGAALGLIEQTPHRVTPSAKAPARVVELKVAG